MKGPKEKLWFFSQGCMNDFIYNTAKSWFKTCRFLIQLVQSLLLGLPVSARCSMETRVFAGLCCCSFLCSIYRARHSHSVAAQISQILRKDIFLFSWGWSCTNLLSGLPNAHLPPYRHIRWASGVLHVTCHLEPCFPLIPFVPVHRSSSFTALMPTCQLHLQGLLFLLCLLTCSCIWSCSSQSLLYPDHVR